MVNRSFVAMFDWFIILISLTEECAKIVNFLRCSVFHFVNIKLKIIQSDDLNCIYFVF